MCLLRGVQEGTMAGKMQKELPKTMMQELMCGHTAKNKYRPEKKGLKIDRSGDAGVYIKLTCLCTENLVIMMMYFNV